MDTLLLLYYLVDYGVVGTFIRSVSLPEPLWYRVTFPYVLHPFKWFSISSSIYFSKTHFYIWVIYFYFTFSKSYFIFCTNIIF